MSFTGKISLIGAILVMVVFFLIQTVVVLGVIDHSLTISLVGYGCFLVFCPLFYMVVKEYRATLERGRSDHELSGVLIHLLGTQFQGNFFDGDRMSDEARFLVEKVAGITAVDRC